MGYLRAAVLLLAISGAAGRDTLQQQVEQGRGYAGEVCPPQNARVTPHTARVAAQAQKRMVTAQLLR